MSGFICQSFSTLCFLIRPIVEELSENRRDGRAEHRLSEVFRSDMSGKCIKNTLVFGCKNSVEKTLSEVLLISGS